MDKKTIPYILLCTGLYLIVSAIEFFPLKPLIDFLGTGYKIHLIVYLILLLIVNPIIVHYLSDLSRLSHIVQNKQQGELL
ncbi:MAG: hypothetical protein IKS69_04750 [Erysipelotrichaceae bacterium]|nr:hypothetical protein [Erysipelotrichaceae bacterium]